MEHACISCKHFRDAHYSKTYISPQCTARGADSAAYMRQYICGLDGRLYEAQTSEVADKLKKVVKQE
jgi:hypothetical protein